MRRKYSVNEIIFLLDQFDYYFKIKSCPPGTYNGPGDPLDGPNTTCNAILYDKKKLCRKSYLKKHVQQVLLI